MKKKTLTQVPLEVSVHLRYLYQDKGMRGKEFLKVYSKVSEATIYCHAKKPVADKTVDNRKYNHGRPRKISRVNFQAKKKFPYFESNMGPLL